MDTVLEYSLLQGSVLYVLEINCEDGVNYATFHNVGGPFELRMQAPSGMCLYDSMKHVIGWLSDFFYHRSALDPEIEQQLMPLNNVDWQNFYDHAVCDLIGED